MKKDEVRRLFPKCVAFADHCRGVFGDGVRLIYAKENGREIGKQTVICSERAVRLSDICIDSQPFSETVERRKKRGK